MRALLPFSYRDQTRGVSHWGLAIYIKKYFEAKRRRRTMETQIFHHTKIYLIFKTNPLKERKKETKILRELISQVSNASQNINFLKASYQNRLVIEGDQNPLSYYYTL
jgi:hypothetical protein